MKDLYQQFMDGGLSRRQFLTGMAGLGVSAYTADSVASELQPYSVNADAEESLAFSSNRVVAGTGGQMLVAQLQAADMPYLFVTPSTGAAPVFDALVDVEDMQIIKSVHEGALIAMADGYARRSGKVPFVMISRAGLPNAMTQMYNSWKDNIPMVVAVDGVSEGSYGQDGFQDIDHMGEMTQPITKWHWRVQRLESIPEVTRRAIKFASTRPGGPVFLSYPRNILRQTGEGVVVDQRKFDIPMQIRPDPEQIRAVATLLLNARNPLLYVGSEITVSGAEQDVIELAELLGLPVVLAGGAYPIHWSLPFPTRHPLYLGAYPANVRYPGKPDVLLNLGGKMPAVGSRRLVDPDVRLVQIRLDPENLARTYPTDIPIVADIKLAVQDLLAELQALGVPGRFRRARDKRYAAAKTYNTERNKHYEKIARDRSDRNPLSIERLLVEMEDVLEKNTCIVSEADSGSGSLHALLTFGGENKQYLSNTGVALGWGVPAAFGAKLANPDIPVVAIVGDGAFLFSGPQPLWSYARYKAPVTVIVLNNRSYNGERNRIWMRGGRQFESGRDMVCYLGDPDVDFAKLAEGFGVAGEVVDEASAVNSALQRAKRANANGMPYLLDVRVERGGIGAQSEWHPEFSIHALRESGTRS